MVNSTMSSISYQYMKKETTRTEDIVYIEAGRESLNQYLVISLYMVNSTKSINSY
jgi:hypothetical protein